MTGFHTNFFKWFLLVISDTSSLGGWKESLLMVCGIALFVYLVGFLLKHTIIAQWPKSTRLLQPR